MARGAAVHGPETAAAAVVAVGTIVLVVVAAVVVAVVKGLFGLQLSLTVS